MTLSARRCWFRIPSACSADSGRCFVGQFAARAYSTARPTLLCRQLIAELQKRLPETDIKTCQDFQHLGVNCCDTCHTFYPHYEMSVIDLPDGAKAWVCDQVRWAIYPEQYQELQEWSQNPPRANCSSKSSVRTPTNRSFALPPWRCWNGSKKGERNRMATEESWSRSQSWCEPCLDCHER